jgi:hypothetical protein
MASCTASKRTRQGQGIHAIHDLLRAQPGRSGLLEWRVGASSLGQVRALEEHRSGIEDRGFEAAEVRRRREPREAGLVEPHLARPSVHRHDREVAVNPERVVVQARQLAERHAVSHGNRVHADERREVGIQDVPFDVHARNGVRAVEHHEGDPLLRRRLHRQRHG